MPAYDIATIIQIKPAATITGFDFLRLITSSRITKVYAITKIAMANQLNAFAVKSCGTMLALDDANAGLIDDINNRIINDILVEWNKVIPIQITID